MHAEERTQTEQGGKSWRFSLSWPMMLLAGWAVYELTAQPGLAALVSCVKFGWADIHTALWLRRVDPDRLRGQTCFWSYLAFGMWKVGVMAGVFLLSLLLWEVFLLRGQGRQVNMSMVEGSLAAAAVGLGCSFPITYLAIYSALRNGVRIWMGIAPSRARRERFWPPRHGNINAAPIVCITTLIITFFVLMLGTAEVLTLWNPVGLFGPVVMGIVLLCVVALFGCYFATSPRVFANSPGQCWSCEEDEDVYQFELPGSGADRG